VAPTREGPDAFAAPQIGQDIQLPKVLADGKMSVERAISTRRSVREFSTEPLTLADISQLTWAGQGITDAAGIKRAAPSAGALYPMELYFFTADGVFHYRPKTHTAAKVDSADRRTDLSAAAPDQASIKRAPCVFVLTSVPERTLPKYKARTPRYIAIEAGHIGQNILLEASALGLVGVPVGSFTDEKVAQVLGLKAGEEPIYILAVGRPVRR
jgi:SagB-type dehydrogenase family enzyme